MTVLEENMRFLCDESRMLTGITAAWGTPDAFESAQYGRAQENPDRPLTPDSLYDLASLTKLFTAAAAMRLVQTGRLSLAEKIGDIEPRFEALREVSVFDVLSFRKSLQSPGRIDDAPTREEGLRRLFASAICPTPAVRVYSDMNAMVIKYIVERKTGLPFYEALEALILRPAGMTQTFSRVPDALLSRCVCYNDEYRITGERFIHRQDVPLGTPNDPKAIRLSDGGRDLCGHAALFSTMADMVKFAQALLGGKLLTPESLKSIGTNYTGRPNPDGTHRQYLGFLCFTKHPNQHLSEVPCWMGEGAIGLSGFTGNHLSLEPNKRCFVLFLGNRCHRRVSHIVPEAGKTLADYGLDARGTGLVRWPSGEKVPSSCQYVYFKDEKLHAPIAARLRENGWLI